MSAERRGSLRIPEQFDGSRLMGRTGWLRTFFAFLIVAQLVDSLVIPVQVLRVSLLFFFWNNIRKFA